MSDQPVICGYCKLPYDEHPVLQCLYAFTAIRDGQGKLIGYEVIDSPLRAIYGTDQPTP